MNDEIQLKYHCTQIESIHQLSNGDIAVSGGPLNFEIIIYRNNTQSEGKINYEIVDSISTKGEQVRQIHEWGCSSNLNNLLIVLASNQFQILSQCMQTKEVGLWRNQKHKVYSFNKIKGDFLNMIQLKQYQRENQSMNFCSSIFLTLHQGYQVVLWEASNYPKLKMKLVWLYVIQEFIQPFCAVEISEQDQMVHNNIQQLLVDENQNQQIQNADVAFGFEKGQIKIFDLSNHFKDQRFQEVRQSFFVSQSLFKKQNKLSQINETNCVQLANKKCGSLMSIFSLKLSEDEVVHTIHSTQTMRGSNEDKKKWFYVSTLSCKIFAVNFFPGEILFKFDLAFYRNEQIKFTYENYQETIKTISNQNFPQLQKPQKKINLCYYFAPMNDINTSKSQFVMMVDNYGICKINLENKAVYQIQCLENQINYRNQILSQNLQLPNQKQAMDQNGLQTDVRSINQDMWQKYNDCIICEQKSIPNSQILVFQTNSKHLFIGFSSTLQILKYEKNQQQKDNMFQKRGMNLSDYEDFEMHNLFDQNEQQLNSKIDKLLNDKQIPDKNIQNSGYAVKTSYHNGVKNYQFVKVENQNQDSDELNENYFTILKYPDLFLKMDDYFRIYPNEKMICDI